MNQKELSIITATLYESRLTNTNDEPFVEGWNSAIDEVAVQLLAKIRKTNLSLNIAEFLMACGAR